MYERDATEPSPTPEALASPSHAVRRQLQKCPAHLFQVSPDRGPAANLLAVFHRA